MVDFPLKKLSEICTLITDGTHNSPEYVDAGIPMLDSKHINADFTIDDSNPTKFISRETDDGLAKRCKPQKGDILISSRGSIGKIAIVGQGQDFNIMGNMILLRVPSVFDGRFLAYCLHSKIEELKAMSTGVAQKGLYLKQVRNFNIAAYPLPEQKRIVAILDEAFAGIDAAVANTEKNLANARELFESYLNAVFTQKGDGWVEKTINDIADVKGGKRVPKGYKLQSEPTKHPYITVANFNDEGSVDLDGLRYVSEEVHAEIRRYTISPKDLYLSIAGTIGKTGIIPEALDGANLTENACKLVFYEGVLNKFVYFFTRTASFADQALLNTRVAAQPKLALSRLSTIRLRIPSIEDQRKVIADCEALWAESQRLETIYQQKLQALAELKQSILQKAFAGELTALPDKTLEEAVA